MRWIWSSIQQPLRRYPRLCPLRTRHRRRPCPLPMRNTHRTPTVSRSPIRKWIAITPETLSYSIKTLTAPVPRPLTINHTTRQAAICHKPIFPLRNRLARALVACSRATSSEVSVPVPSVWPILITKSGYGSSYKIWVYGLKGFSGQWASIVNCCNALC